MSTDKYQRLRDALAAGPTPGPWRHEAWGSRILDSGVGSRQLLITTVAANTFRDQGRHNAEFIAAADPETIAALLAERDALREALYRINLASQNSMSSKDECGRIARAALAMGEGNE